jgi:hypothetical protein
MSQGFMGRNETVTYLKSLDKNFPNETAEILEKLQLIRSSSGPKFETRTSDTRPNLCILNPLFQYAEVRGSGLCNCGNKPSRSIPVGELLD